MHTYIHKYIDKYILTFTSIETGERESNHGEKNYIHIYIYILTHIYDILKWWREMTTRSYFLGGPWAVLWINSISHFTFNNLSKNHFDFKSIYKYFSFLKLRCYNTFIAIIAGGINFHEFFQNFWKNRKIT